MAADGTEVWGRESGGYRFRRMKTDGDATACVDPVRMLVLPALPIPEYIGPSPELPE